MNYLPDSQPDRLTNVLGGRLDQLVENKLTLAHDVAELHVYETFQAASRVDLLFTAPVLTSMLKGKKVMHLDSLAPFTYLPGESLLLPAYKPMQIDFPDASPTTPTRCMALTMDAEFIQQTVDYLNETYPRVEEQPRWQLTDNNYHLRNDIEMNLLIDKIMRMFRERDSPFTSFFIQHSLKELVMRLMQTQARTILLDQTEQYVTTHRLAYVVDYIRKNITRALSINELCDKACLSKSHFFRLFKTELGTTPVQFILNERIQLAKRILRNPAKSVTDACYESGFNSLTHFSSAFRAVERISPRQFVASLKGVSD